MLLVGERPSLFHLVDPAEFSEIEFEAEAVKALCGSYPDYLCGVFRGGFRLDHERRGADLALIHKSLSHWFVVEVEILSHSLQRHVLPQARCFRYGDPEPECISSLCNAFPELTRHHAESLVQFVPRSVAVVTNRFHPEWHATLQGLDVQLITVSVFRNAAGHVAHELEGRLQALRENLGFAIYSATDRSLRLPRSKLAALPLGKIRIEDPFGGISLWTVRETEQSLWITKDVGDPVLPHNEYLQLIKTYNGHITLRLPH